jgi:hypothetical protein
MVMAHDEVAARWEVIQGLCPSVSVHVWFVFKECIVYWNIWKAV